MAWVVFPSTGFTVTAGAPVSFRSSPDVIRTFCGRCGTPLTYQRPSQPGTIDVTTATLDDADRFAPTKEIWTEHRLAWERVSDALPQYPRSSVGASLDED